MVAARRRTAACTACGTLSHAARATVRNGCARGRPPTCTGRAGGRQAPRNIVRDNRARPPATARMKRALMRTMAHACPPLCMLAPHATVRIARTLCVQAPHVARGGVHGGIQLVVGPQQLRLRNQNFGLSHRIMVKRLATSPHDPLGITDSSCKNQSVMVSVQYGPFNTYIPIRSTTIGKSRVARDPITMHTSRRSNSDIACVTRWYMGLNRPNGLRSDLQDVRIAIGSLATLDLPMVVDLIGIYGLKGPYCTLTTTKWFLQALCVLSKCVYLVTLAMSLFDLQDVRIAIGSLATLDLPMVVDLIGIYGLKGPYCTLTTTKWFLQALSVIPRGSWGDVARRFYHASPLPPGARRRHRHRFAGICSGQLDEENPSAQISSSLLVQADEGVLNPVVDLIDDIYRRLP
ncbi:hypothetical protein F511_17749 [Dorcoceras hygrometricum]|uniref:Uncharacterized protein n=1 Tax=Dorcoceras hygrometricum TaxID=472368 RepID=A0A2Z7AYD1_9LAMI|nr:hypothetical protein F511_17749 [Dorcoceras hygrometricum]